MKRKRRQKRETENNTGHALSFSLDTRRISPSFYSLAHAGINQDVSSHRLSSRYRNQGFSFNTSLEKQHDNVDNDPSKASIHSQILSTSVDYSPSNKQNTPSSFWGRTPLW